MQLLAEMSSWRVLVVDDEPDNLELAADVLEFSGATVIRALGGQRALQLFDEQQPNIVLLDLAMPDVDGWEVYRHLRARKDGAALVIIALTALAMSADAYRVRTIGFNGYITKPFRVQALLQEIAECVKKHNEVTPAAFTTQENEQ